MGLISVIMRNFIFSLVILVAVAAVAATPVFVLPRGAVANTGGYATNLTVVGMAVSGVTNTGGIFTGTNTFTGILNATNTTNTLAGNGAGLTSLTAANISAGTAGISITGNAATATTATNFNGSLTGDVTGTQGATVVATVNSQTAAVISAGAVTANAGTNANTVSTLVKRDGSGNFAAGTITAALVGDVTGNLTGNATTATTATNVSSATNFSGALVGDVTGTQGATVVSTVGAQTAANVAAGAVLANAATSANTASAIVKRDGSGNFTAGTITATLSGNASTATTATNASYSTLAGTATNSPSGNIDTNLALKAPLASPTFTGIVTATNMANGLGLVGSPSYTFTGDTDTGLWSSGGNTLNFSTAGLERVRIDSSGRLAIGTTAAVQLMTINSDIALAAIALQIGMNTKAFFGVSPGADDPISGMTSGDLGIRVQGTNDIFLSANGGSSGQFVLKNSGNVGIGTATPSTALHVGLDGSSMALGTGLNVSATLAVAGSRAFFGYDAGHARVQGAPSKGVTLAVNGAFGEGTVALHATSAGLVGINTLSAAYDFDVNGVIQSRGSSGGVRQYTGSATNQNRMVGVVKTITTTVANIGLTETNLMTETFPASGLAATGDTVEILMFGTTAANANSKTVAAYFGGTKVVQSAAFTTSAAAWRITGTITRTGAATQVACVTCSVDGATTVTTYTAPTETLSGTITIKATGTAPTANSDITQVFQRTEFKPGNP